MLPRASILDEFPHTTNPKHFLFGDDIVTSRMEVGGLALSLTTRSTYASARCNYS